MTTTFGTADELGLPAFTEADDILLGFPAASLDGGFLVTPGVSGAVASYSMVFDLFIPSASLTGAFGALFQTDLGNSGDADFFMRAQSPTAFGIGISGQYDGAAAYDAWHRVAVTLDDNGDGTSTMKKFIDGTKVGEQTVDTARFTIDGDNGFLLLTDENGETYSGYLNSFLVTDEAMTEQAIADLGGATANGILSEAPATGNATQFDFEDKDLSPSFGDGAMADRSDGGGAAAVEIVKPIQDMMVTPDADNVVIDLTAVFEGEGLTYTVENSDGAVLSVVPSAEGTLELDFESLGFSDIKVTATDADGNSATDWFRARVAGENAYTIAVMPDTQNYTTSAARAPTFENMTQWLADNAAAKNLQFVLHVGDVTGNNRPDEWEIARDAYSKLDGVVPYSVVPGNHDQAAGGTAADFSSLISEYFKPEDYAAENGGTLGGTYKGDMSNNYHTFTAPDGTKWMVLSLEFGARDDVTRWAQSVIEDHLDHRVILSNHHYMNFPDRSNPLSGPLFAEGTGHNYGMVRSPEGSSDGEELWRDLVKKYPNVSFTFSGHVFGDGAETLVSYSDYGTPVYQMVVNYQNGVSGEIQQNGVDGRGGNGGNGAIRLLTIDPDNDTVWTETYFVNFDEYLTASRDKDEYDRDGLTGAYREHQETLENFDVGAPTVYAKAKAGDDQFVSAEGGSDTTTVTLDAGGSVDPNGEIVAYKWVDAEGRTVATGETAEVELAGGRHDLTLVTTDVNGVTNADDIRVVVSTDKTLLMDNFNDGDFDGWADDNQVDEPPLGDQLALGTPAGFGIADLPGGEAVVVSFPRSTNNQGYGVAVDFEPESGDVFSQYSMVFDIYFPSQAGNFAAFFQTNTANLDDGEAFLRADGGIGISGVYDGQDQFSFDAWHRIAFTFEDMGGSLTLRKYIDGVKVGEQSVDPARFSIDPDKGFLILTDENGEVYSGYLNSFLFTADLLSDADLAALGGPDADGILDAAPAGDRAIQFDYDTGFEPTFGAGQAFIADLTDQDARATWKVKGTVASREGDDPDLPAPEGALYEYFDSNATLIWDDAAAKDWSDYVAEVTILSQDDDTVGLAVYYQDADNHYKITLDTQLNQRQLVKVKDGVETVLAESAQGYPFNDEMELRVAVVGNSIYATLDGKVMFGGPVTDAADPLTGGTVGLLSVGQFQSIFDDVMVNEASVTAHAGIDRHVTDLDGDHKETVTLDATGSFAPDGIASYVWKDGDTVIATGAKAEVDLATGAHAITLVVTDQSGATHEDLVEVSVFNNEQVLLADDFQDGDSNGWTVVDEGELGDAADWSVAGGALVQAADTYSRELAPDSEAGGVWRKQWSPHGDGWHVLRKGTYALYDEAPAYDWADYAMETIFHATDEGGVGLLFHYRDPNNYYKLELDSDDRFTQLTVLKDGIEKSLMLTRNSFSLDEDHTLRVEVRDNQIQAYLDDMALFAHPIEDRNIETGTVGLYSWGTAGVSFDDVLVRELDPAASAPAGGEIVGTPDDDTLVGTDGDDDISGGRGEDTVDGKGGDDDIDGGRDADMAAGGAGEDNIKGGRGDDTIDGGDGDDDIAGGRGDDLIDGGDGDDDIDGGRGNDILNGGAGDDRLTGGRDDDQFVFDSGSGDDVVTDFKPGDDLIQLNGFAIDDFADVLAAAADDGDDVVITLDDGAGDIVRLIGVNKDDLSADDFSFGVA